jgi:prepilin-type N-terminal cleavage/methylation domain-containing protein
MAWCTKLTKFFSSKNQGGYSLVELLLAISLFSILITVLFTGFIASRDGKPQQQQRLQAASILQETVEALRVVREQGWPDFAVEGVYHPVIDDIEGTWTLAAGPETVGFFTRQITIGPVQRDANGNIVDSGGTVDPSTKRIDIEVSWSQPLITALNSTMFFTRYLDNLSFVHTTVADFELSGHIADNTAVIPEPTAEDPDNAIVRLSPLGTGRGDWCNPGDSVVSLSLQGNAPEGRVAAFYNSDANRTDVLLTAGNNNSVDGVTYIRVTDDYPPVPSVENTYGSPLKTGGVYVVQGYAFVATQHGAGGGIPSGVQIFDLTNLSIVGEFNPNVNVNGLSIFIKDNVGYLTQGSVLRTFDASSPIGSRSQLGSVGLAGTGTKVQVVGNYAYVSTSSTTSQLQIIDVSNPSSPVVVRSFGGSDLPGGLGGKSLFVSESGERVYLVTAKSSSVDGKLFIINTSDKNNPSVISSRSTGNMNPNAVTVVLNENRAIVVGVGGNEYQVWSIVNESNPTSCGSLGNLGGVYDVVGVVQENGDAYAHVLTAESNAQFKIVEGGPGGAFSTTGTYESATFDAGIDTAFNRLSFDANIPAETTLRFQISSNFATAGSCNGVNFDFVGPDGTADTFFEAVQGLPFNSTAPNYNNPGRCFRYKAYFDTDNVDLTPLLDKVTVNYSP